MVSTRRRRSGEDSGMGLERLTAHHANDAIGYGDDDDGFTADFGGRLDGSIAGTPVSLTARQRLITQQDGLARTDYFTLEGEALALRAETMEIALSVGGGASGNLFGAEVQEGWHRCINVGRRRDRTGYDTLRKAYAPLQSLYPLEHRAALLLGGRVGLPHDPRAIVQPLAGVEGKLALGDTGVSYVRGYLGVETNVPITRHVDFTLSAMTTLGAYATADPALKMRGGYVAGGPRGSLAVSAGFTVHGASVTLTEELGRDGSDNNGGVIAIGVPLP